MTTYATFNQNDSSNAVEGQTLRDAAQVLLTADSYDYEIRPDDTGWSLWVSQFSGASPLGGRPLVRSRFFSVERHQATAEADIFQAVVREEWHGMRAMPDADYAAMLAEMAAE